MYNPPNDYRKKTNWSEAEDKALITIFGLTSIEEICEAYMCSPFCIISRARILGIMPPEHSLITAQDIEWMIRLLETGAGADELAEKFGLPDHNFKYIIPRDGALSACRREVQDYYAKQNDDQLSLFGDDSA